VSFRKKGAINLDRFLRAGFARSSKPVMDNRSAVHGADAMQSHHVTIQGAGLIWTALGLASDNEVLRMTYD
jgi:hypothetical protein